MIGDSFMAYLGIVLCFILWLVCGLFYGLIGGLFFMAGLWTILWPNLGIFWDPFCGWFVDCFIA